MRHVWMWIAAVTIGCGTAVGACGDDDGANPDPEICDNGSDDDGDGLADCLDADCTSDPYCSGPCHENGTCEAGETNANCPADCPAVCPNGTCEATEDASSCPEDCASGQCSGVGDLLNQTGCNAGEACDVVDQANNIGCRNAGSAAHYDPCTSAADCQAGDSCISLDGINLFCAPFCDPDTELCPGSGTCYIALGDLLGVQACGIITLDDCDLVTYATCDSGQGCYLADANGGTICMTAGNTPAGEPCTYANDCEAGFGCVGQAPDYTCVALCKDTADCTVGTCEGIGNTFPNTPDVGFCAE